MAVRPLRRRLLGNPVVRTILSVWAWLVFGVLIVVWVPLVAVVRLVTAPFDKGRYAAGYLFRKLTVVHQLLNPLWRFKTSGVKIADPRRPYIVVANHQSFVDMDAPSGTLNPVLQSTRSRSMLDGSRRINRSLTSLRTIALP